MEIVKREASCYKKALIIHTTRAGLRQRLKKKKKIKTIGRFFFVQIVQIKGFYKLITKQLYKLYTQKTSIKHIFKKTKWKKNYSYTVTYLGHTQLLLFKSMITLMLAILDFWQYLNMTTVIKHNHTFLPWQHNVTKIF